MIWPFSLIKIGRGSEPRVRPCFPILAFIKKHDPDWWAANRHRSPSAVREWPGFEKYKGRHYDDKTLEFAD